MTLTAGQPAYLDALFNVARFGASRFGAFSGQAFISIDGGFFGDTRPDAMSPGILRDSMTIQDILDDTPNTLTFTAWQFKPRIGAEVIVTLGSKSSSTRLFAGYVISVSQAYLSRPANIVYHTSCIDYTWRLMQLKASGRYVNVSATAIVMDLLARFAPNVSARYVQAGLPALADLIVTNEDLPTVFKRIASRIGAYFYVDELGALHFFTVEARQQPRNLTPDHPSLSAVEREEDLSQMVTRALSEGGGGQALVPVAAGTATIPVDVGTWYAPEGGFVSVGPNRVQYASVVAVVGGGSLVGPGVTPTVAPTATPVNGGTLPVGTFKYAFTFQTAAGESKPSPLASVTTVAPFQLLPSAVAPGVRISAYGTTELTPGASYQYGFTYLWSNGQTAMCPPSAPIVADGVHGIDVLPTYDGLNINCTGARFYRSVNGGPYYYFHDVTGPGFPSPIYDRYDSDFAIANIGIQPPANNAGGLMPGKQQVQLSTIATGPAAVTNRKIYRTTVDGTQLKLLQTLAGNVSTGPITDTTADASLGANAPAGDTSGLQGVTGQINAGDTSMIVAGTGWADPAGGWAVIGNGRQVIRYTGVTAGSLTGIPTTGIGAIVGAVPFNSSITAAPTLTGIPASGTGAVVYTVPEGTPVNVLAIVDDLNAQAAVRGMMPGHSGIIEDIISDGRLSRQEAQARANALLAARMAPLVTLRYSSRDVTTRSGTTVAADLPAPTNIHDTLKVQQVTIDHFDLSPKTNTPPTFHVTASSERFSFEDLLRQATQP